MTITIPVMTEWLIGTEWLNGIGACSTRVTVEGPGDLLKRTRQERQDLYFARGSVPLGRRRDQSTPSGRMDRWLSF